MNTFISRTGYYVFGLVIATVMTGHHHAMAELVVSNLSEPPRFATPIGNPEYWAAQSFVTGSNPLTLSSITILGGAGLNSPMVVSELRAATGIDGDIDISGTGLIETFTAPSMDGAMAERDFFSNGSTLLMADTKYWFIIGSSNAGTFEWNYADTNLFTGSGSLGNFADSSDGGTTWNHHTTNDFPYFIEVNAVPEPSGLVLFGVVSCGCLTRRRRFNSPQSTSSKTL